MCVVGRELGESLDKARAEAVELRSQLGHMKCVKATRPFDASSTYHLPVSWSDNSYVKSSIYVGAVAHAYGEVSFPQLEIGEDSLRLTAPVWCDALAGLSSTRPRCSATITARTPRFYSRRRIGESHRVLEKRTFRAPLRIPAQHERLDPLVLETTPASWCAARLRRQTDLGFLHTRWPHTVCLDGRGAPGPYAPSPDRVYLGPFNEGCRAHPSVQPGSYL